MGGTEYRWDGLDALEQELTRMIEQTYPEEFKKLVIQIAYELQGRVKQRTPIGPTGRLADGWEVGPIKKSGENHIIEVYNNVEYVEPVEEGHRTRRGTGKKASKVSSVAFVPGVHMMAISLEEVSSVLPGYLRDWLSEFISTHDL